MSSVLRGLVLGLCSAMAPAFAPAQDIVLGQTLSLTGASANVARDLQRGRQACVDWVNSHGGVRGRSLKLLTRDDKGDAELAVKFAQELSDREGAMALLGPMGPVVNAALLKWAKEQAMPVLGPYGGDIEIRRGEFETAFFLTANQSAEAARLAAHLVSLGLRRVVIVHGTDGAGRAALVALEEALAITNVPASALLAARSDGSDAAAVAQAIARADAQAVLLATSGRATSAMLKVLTSGSSGGAPLLQVYGLSSSASPAELIELGARARGFAMSQVVPLPRDGRLGLVTEFQAAMRGLPGERTFAELEGCMGPLLLAEVLRHKPAALSRAGMLQALKAAGRVNLGGFEVDLGDRNKIGSRFTDLVYVGSDGRVTR